MNINRSDVAQIVLLVVIVFGVAFGLSVWSREEVTYQNKVIFSSKDSSESIYAIGETVVTSDHGVDIEGEVYLFLNNSWGVPRISGPAQGASIRTTSANARISTEGEGTVSGYLEETQLSVVAVAWPDGSSVRYYPADLPSGSDSVEVTDLSISFWVDHGEAGCQFDINLQMWRCQVTLAEDGVSGPTAFIYVKK